VGLECVISVPYNHQSRVDFVERCLFWERDWEHFGGSVDAIEWQHGKLRADIKIEINKKVKIEFDRSHSFPKHATARHSQKFPGVEVNFYNPKLRCRPPNTRKKKNKNKSN
jgi:hypothetical protein